MTYLNNTAPGFQCDVCGKTIARLDLFIARPSNKYVLTLEGKGRFNDWLQMDLCSDCASELLDYIHRRQQNASKS